MLGLTLGEAKDTSAAASPRHIGLQTPVRHDPQVLVDLRAKWRELRVALKSLVLARRCGDASRAAQAGQACARQMHELSCKEALHVFPVVSRHFADDPLQLSQLQQQRLELLRLGRRFLRLLDELSTHANSGSEQDGDIALMWDVLEVCIAARQNVLYRLYDDAKARAPGNRSGG